MPESTTDSVEARAGTTVLHYVGYDRSGGGVLSMLHELDTAGRFTSLLGVAPSFPVDAESLGCVVLPRIAAEQIGLRSWWAARRVAREVARWLEAGPHRVFHGHSRAGLLVALQLRAAGERRAMATVHCLGRQRWFYRWAARKLGPALAWLGPAMKRHYGIADRSWIGCLPDCVGERRLRESPRWGRARSRPVVGCAGALVPVKEWEHAVDALAQLPPDLSVEVLHAGGEDGTVASATYAARLRERIARSGVGNRWQWLGSLGQERSMGAAASELELAPPRTMTEFYSRIDALVITSRREASSMAALEAAAAGVPVLAPEGSGTRDLIEAARIGWLFPDANATALARALTELVRSNAFAAWRRDEAAFRQFTAPVVAARHAERYQWLLSS